MFQLVKIVGRYREMVAGRGPAIFSANYLDKRNAGHSEAANRKAVKEATGKRKSMIIDKLRRDILNEVKKSKNANLETNPRLQAIFNEAHKASVHTEALQKLVKSLESSMKNDKTESYVFQHDLGITYVVEMNESLALPAKSQQAVAKSIMKKFGFKFVGVSSEMLKVLGIIYCKPLDNVMKDFDQALEDAISANCEEVVQKDEGYFEFICNELQLDMCKKTLEDTGYEINYTEKRYAFPTYVKVNEAVLQKLDKIHEKFGYTSGFLSISHNIEK